MLAKGALSLSHQFLHFLLYLFKGACVSLRLQLDDLLVLLYFLLRQHQHLFLKLSSLLGGQGVGFA